MATSLAKALRVLDLFSLERPQWSAEGVGQALDLSRPTAFRYLRDLVDAGLLRRFGDGNYVLGPRCIQLDWQIRVGDPLLAAAVPEMARLRDESGCGVTLIGESGEQFIGLHLETGPGGEAFLYGRGRPMPRFLGSPSKMLMACLPLARQRRLYEAHATEAAACGLGSTWPEFKARLNAIRRQNVCASIGEVQADLGGIATVVRDAGGAALGALTLVFLARRAEVLDHARLRALLWATAQRIELALQQHEAGLLSPMSAVVPSTPLVPAPARSR